MNRWMKTLLVVALALSAIAVVGPRASADTAGDDVERGYADAMWYFIPELGRYAADLDRTLAAAEVKPEMAAQLAELAGRGATFTADLEGTPVPSEMAETHERLLAAVRQLNESAQIGADDPAGARYLYESYEPMLQDARHDVRGWLMARMTIGSASGSPAFGLGQ